MWIKHPFRMATLACPTHSFIDKQVGKTLLHDFIHRAHSSFRFH